MPPTIQSRHFRRLPPSPSAAAVLGRLKEAQRVMLGTFVPNKGALLPLQAVVDNLAAHGWHGWKPEQVFAELQALAPLLEDSRLNRRLEFFNGGCALTGLGGTRKQQEQNELRQLLLPYAPPESLKRKLPVMRQAW